ncbi:MAG: RnfABCDGE type electron transport complex subunit D [Deltaproteobacteria bacterium]|nr:RnfABCDGE type electron transport complex subunit D [Deltaproteobacteria bacterium]
MSKPLSRLLIHPAPFLKSPVDTPSVMFDVLLAALGVTVVAIFSFGLSAALVVAAAALGAVGTEYLFGRRDLHSLADWSGPLTGVLIGLTLPPGFPLWMAFLGGVVGMGLGKVAWGGLGQNLFNPALVGRAFLQAAFPTAITTWTPNGQGLTALQSSNLALPMMHGTVDGITTATPLGLAKFEHHFTGTLDLFVGNTGGSLGETNAMLLLLLLGFLIWKRALDWRIPVSIIGTVAALSAVFWFMDPTLYPSPVFMVFSGGLLFGAIFMATDPVTSPMAPKGSYTFGFGIGLLVVLIRLFGGLPEGVMYAILLMNAIVPHLNRAFQPVPFGRGRKS